MGRKDECISMEDPEIWRGGPSSQFLKEIGDVPPLDGYRVYLQSHHNISTSSVFSCLDQF